MDARRVLPKYIRGLRLKYAALPIVEDARTVRPYLSCERPLVYLGNLLAHLLKGVATASPQRKGYTLRKILHTVVENFVKCVQLHKFNLSFLLRGAPLSRLRDTRAFHKSAQN